MSWSLYELSRHPDVQASLREEVLTVLGGRRVPEASDVARMPLLKATIKEVLRYDNVNVIFPPVRQTERVYRCLLMLLGAAVAQVVETWLGEGRGGEPVQVQLHNRE